MPNSKTTVGQEMQIRHARANSLVKQRRHSHGGLQEDVFTPHMIQEISEVEEVFSCPAKTFTEGQSLLSDQAQRVPNVNGTKEIKTDLDIKNNGNDDDFNKEINYYNLIYEICNKILSEHSRIDTPLIYPAFLFVTKFGEADKLNDEHILSKVIDNCFILKFNDSNEINEEVEKIMDEKIKLLDLFVAHRLADIFEK